MSGVLSRQSPSSVLGLSPIVADSLNRDLEAGATGSHTDNAKNENENKDEENLNAQNVSLATVDRRFIVDWDEPDDPANPLNWSPTRKWVNMGIVSAITLITYVKHHQNFLTHN
jgi:hypothetical protein